MTLGFNNKMSRPARKGVTAVLAMLYLTLMASLALGFYSASNTAVMVSHNEQRVERARLAAESGIQFVHFHLTRILIPGKIPPEQRFDDMAAKLALALNGSGNLNAGSIYVDSDTIRIPADPKAYIKCDERGSDFQVLIEKVSTNTIRVSAAGRHGETFSTAQARAVKLDFILDQHLSKIFQYGIATRG